MGIIIAVVAVLCNKAYDPPEPYIDVDKLKEISKRNSHFLTKGPCKICYALCHRLFEPRCEKTGLWGFRPGPTHTGLYSHIRWLEA